MKPLDLVRASIAACFLLGSMNTTVVSAQSSADNENSQNHELNLRPISVAVSDQWDKNCRFLVPEKILCAAKVEANQNEPLKIEIETSPGCIYGRLYNPAFWVVHLTLGEKELVAIRSEYGVNNADFSIIPIKLEKSELYPNEPFQMTISESMIEWKKFQIHPYQSLCRPHSKLTNDYCQFNEYRVATESIKISNLQCQRN